MNINEKVLECLYANILEKRIEETERLLSISGANPNELIKSKGISLLHLAAGIEPDDYADSVVKLLLKYGGDPNIRSEEGMTALHIGAAWGRVSVIKTLLLAGGNPCITDLDGKTALDYATEHDNQEVADCFYFKDVESNSCDSPRKYSLKLDKILVCNGAVEGEYYPEDLMNVETFRKSDYIKEWFARSPIVESPKAKEIFLRDDCLNDSTPTNSVKIHSNGSSNMVKANNISNGSGSTVKKGAFQQCKNEITPSNDTLYESCLSSNYNEKNNQVYKYLSKSLFSNGSCKTYENESNNLSLFSGIVPIEISEDSCNNRGNINDFKVPLKLEPHQNYKSRTHIKRNSCKILEYYNNEDYGCSTFLTSNHSERSCDLEADRSSSECTQRSDNLNEALMTTDISLTSGKSLNSIKTNNSIKSSFSHLNNGFVTTTRGNGLSFSSKNASLLNETTASVAEEYKYHDEEAGVALIEKRVLVNVPLTINVNTSANQSGALSSISSVASSLPMSLDYDTDTLRKELKSFGVAPGPITTTTKKVYLRRLHNIRKNPVAATNLGKNPIKTYSIELEKTFRDPNWNSDLSSYVALERILAQQFEEPNPNKKWREGVLKSSFTYLLLDPRISDNLPCRADTMQSSDIWKNFIDSIFYIGKGKRSRPYSHLYEAVTLHKTGEENSSNEKVQTILNIWKEKCGVICLHIFQNVIPVEAYTREAAMIEVMGLKNLKNIKPGNYYGSVATWSLKQKKLLGVYLLYRAMSIFLNEGERQLRPADIK